MTRSESELRDLLSHWSAFAAFEQRLLAFLANEVAHTGQAFENSTEGAVTLLAKLSEAARAIDNQHMLNDIDQLVQQLQGADRHRQELLQVTSVIQELLRQQTELITASSTAFDCEASPPDWTEWCRGHESAVTLSTWRRRLIAALNGTPLAAEDETQEQDESDILF